jgi:serine/threonine protein kinase
MSPEQLEGREVDARTDVFAFGVTLYEMVTGRKAFNGTSAASVSAAILTSEPAPVSSSAGGDTVVPPGLDHIIRRALAKHPDERWQTARDMMLELRWLKDGRPAKTTRPSTVRGPRWLAAGAVVVAVAVLAGRSGGGSVSGRENPSAGCRSSLRSVHLQACSSVMGSISACRLTDARSPSPHNQMRVVPGCSGGGRSIRRLRPRW